MSPKVLVSVDDKPCGWIDRWVKLLNSKRRSWDRPTNRQAVINACIEYAMLNDMQFNKGYSKYLKGDIGKQIKTEVGKMGFRPK